MIRPTVETAGEVGAVKAAPAPEGTHFRFSPRSNQANLIPWREWGEEAFQEAKEKDRPVLLAISAVWCHWCHVMDETSYSDPQVRQLLADAYVPIRVDNDQRPDVNERYNLGGWPTTAVLRPDGEILTGGTYIPAEAMRAFLRQAASYYHHHRGALAAQSPSVVPSGLSPARAGRETVEALYTVLEENYDEGYGGFGTEPKFPHCQALEFLLTLATDQKGNARRAKGMLQRTLRAMARGGMFDEVEGGFFRYSTTRDWSIPHYEKMAEDNAALLGLCLRAGSVFGDPEFLRVAVRVLTFMEERLRDPSSGLFHGSQDADEEYYRLPVVERGLRTAPLVDPVLYTDRSAQGACAYLAGGNFLGEEKWREAGLGTLESIWEICRSPAGGLFHYRSAGEGRLSGLLGDQLAGAEAFLDAHEATGDFRWLDRAQWLTAFIRERFRGPEGALTDRWAAEAGPGRLGQRNYPLEANARMAVVELRLAALLGEEERREEAGRLLAAFGGSYGKYGFLAAAYGRAVELLHRPWLTVTLVGDPGDPATAALRAVAQGRYASAKAVRTVAVRNGEEASRAGLAVPFLPAAFVCLGQTCYPPTADPVELAVRMAADEVDGG